jgi:RHS repeat-associated protein
LENNAYESVTTAYGYAGEYTDAASGMVYLRARYYSPYLNQFIQPDPILPANGDRYSYVGNNPINYIDPTGMYRWRFSSDPIYHQAIENEYASRNFGIMGLFLNPIKQLEYTIPGVGKRPDMFNSLTGDVFEIEPINNIREGQRQVLDYVALLQQNRNRLHGEYLGQPYDWTNTIFHIGFQKEWGEKYRKNPLNPIFYPYLDLVADYNSQGVIAYWWEFNDLLLKLIPVYLAQKAKTPNDRLIMPRNFSPQPGLAYFGPGEYSTFLNMGTSDCMKWLFVYGIAQGHTVYQMINDPIPIGIPDGIIRSPDNRGVYFLNIALSLAYYLPLLALVP